ncbi:MAG: hypothetical protein ACW975_10670 [Candidatus Thorarchaeota archaeon]|jgi:hypothetical protein
MLLSGLIGVLFGRYLSDKKHFLVIALVIGFVLGIFGEMGLVYPFYIDIQRDIVHIPEMAFYGFFFLHPNIKLLDLPIWYTDPLILPPIIHVVFVVASVGGALLGYLVGYNWQPSIKVID